MSKTIDVALIGGGIMSATLGTLLQRLDPDLSIEVYERLGEVAVESSNPWNNAGTGHAALCELNYTPEAKDGTVTAAKAVGINEQFQQSRQFWSALVEEGFLPEPEQFIVPTPHMSFVWGDDNVDYLRRRYEALKDEPLFLGMRFSTDPKQIAKWAPALMVGRDKDQRVAATYSSAGTDVNFGALTKLLLQGINQRGAQVYLDTSVRSLKRGKDGIWTIKLRNEIGNATREVRAKFVFVGAGGGALSLLQKSGIKEAHGFGGFPITGQFLRCDNPEVVARHDAKVYGKASVGAPPMSVPHLDTRVVDGKPALLFGPFAGWNSKFLKTGSYFDLFASLRLHNLYPMIRAGLANFDLVGYLLGEIFSTREKQLDALRQFYPDLDPDDWYLIDAGQRVQVMKKDDEKGGVLQFGTELVTGADGSIAGLLGASPGASTAVPIMLQLLEKCFDDRVDGWRDELSKLVPSWGTSLNDDFDAAVASMTHTADVLDLAPVDPDAKPDDVSVVESADADGEFEVEVSEATAGSSLFGSDSEEKADDVEEGADDMETPAADADIATDEATDAEAEQEAAESADADERKQ